MIEITYLKKLKNLPIRYKISLRILLVLSLIFFLARKYLPLYCKTCLLWLENHILLTSYVIIPIIFSLILSWMYLLIKIKQIKRENNQFKQELENKLFLEFGIYWDKKFNPYCPVCGKPLGRIAEFEQKYYSDSYCYKCNKNIPISDDEGQLTISEAQIKLRKQHGINHNQ